MHSKTPDNKLNICDRSTEIFWSKSSDSDWTLQIENPKKTFLDKSFSKSQIIKAIIANQNALTYIICIHVFLNLHLYELKYGLSLCFMIKDLYCLDV